ncbi:hypothetical protein [Nocardia sp. N2S4-5]|uniref:hypothetical protein n=1 Tax=Nocardia sp. N2S4-5 TaxID=3351565 RepID=UPI0037D6D62F
MMIPVVGDLLDAMDGRFDPHHPQVDILRAAWLLATFDSWFAPRSVHAMRIDAASGNIAHLESGAEALHALDVDLALVTGDALIDRIAAAVGGDREYALAVDELAISWSVVHETRTRFSRCVDSDADARFGEACRDYEQVARTHRWRYANRSARLSVWDGVGM